MNYLMIVLIMCKLELVGSNLYRCITNKNITIVKRGKQQTRIKVKGKQVPKISESHTENEVFVQHKTNCKNSRRYTRHFC